MAVSLSSLLKNYGANIAAMEAEQDLDVSKIELGRRGNEYIGSKSLDPNAPMEVRIVTDEIIDNANLKEVVDPISLSGGDYTEGGIFSEYIFGRTPDERDRQFAYIDLHEKFFHPYVFEVLDKLMPKKFKKCAAGEGSWDLDENGHLRELHEGDKGFEKKNSGITWLREIYFKMKIPESESFVRKDRLKLLKLLKPNEVFISKWLVCPVKYRDIDKNEPSKKMPDLDNSYNSLIRYANSLQNSVFGLYDYAVRFNLQMELVNIRKLGQSLLEGKKGFFHQGILGKSIDRGSRDVISVPSFKGCQRPEDSPVDIFHSGIPLAKCLIIGYDFIMRYCLSYFSDSFRNVTEYPVYKLVGGEWKIDPDHVVPIKDQTQIFTSNYIEKKINRFKNSHGTRFDPITITAQDGSQIPIMMTGAKSIGPVGKKYENTILSRPMTWTDLFYQAAYNTISDKYVYITRYPIEGYNSIFPTQIHVMSTLDTIPVDLEGVHYPYYPVINPSLSKERISNMFNDTVTMSDLCLDAIGGD